MVSIQWQVDGEETCQCIPAWRQSQGVKEKAKSKKKKKEKSKKMKKVKDEWHSVSRPANEPYR